MQAELRIDDLPDDALSAARAFHSDWTDRVADMLAGECSALAIVLAAAPYDHADWRRGVARDLARRHAPKRVNIVGGDDGAGIAATLAYLAGAPGVTGQYLEIDGQDGTDRAQ